MAEPAGSTGDVGGERPDRGRRWRPGQLEVAALGVVAIRLIALVWVGPGRHPMNYDEGAYFSAAALLGRGSLPYRDAAMAHPPGIAYALALPSRIGAPSTAFLVARAITCFVGGANAYLVGRIARRYSGLGPALAAMALYVSLPVVALSERSVLIEPYLNLFCLLAAAIWLRRRATDAAPELLARDAWLCGLALGAAATFKFWAVVMVVPLVVTARPGRRVADLARLAGGSAVGFVGLTVPVAVWDPGAFMEQTVWFQLLRPSGPGPSPARRLVEVLGSEPNMLATRALVGTLFVVAAVVVLVLGRRDRATLFGVAWFAGAGAMFVLGSAFDMQYTAFLGPAIALAASGPARVVVDALRSGRTAVRVAATGVAALALVGVVHNLRWVRGDAMARTDAARSVGDLIRSERRCIFALDPGVLIAGDRLPHVDRIGALASEPAVAPLGAAAAAGEASMGMAAPTNERMLRRAMLACPVVATRSAGEGNLGGLGDWFRSTHREIRREPVTELGLWERRPDRP